MGLSEDVKRAIGAADACELLSYAFAFPDRRLAQGLIEGTLADDARTCLLDAGAPVETAGRVGEALDAWKGLSVDDLLSDMRKTYSHLYLAPGGHTPIFPYESAFLHVERGLPGVPSLFRTPVTLDVERHIREAGVVAKNARKEPCDSVFEEFEFLSYLYAKQADALHSDERDNAQVWEDRARAFESEHVLAWLPSFMRRTQEQVEGGPYAAFAELGLAMMGERL